MDTNNESSDTLQNGPEYGISLLDIKVDVAPLQLKLTSDEAMELNYMERLFARVEFKTPINKITDLDDNVAIFLRKLYSAYIKSQTVHQAITARGKANQSANLVYPFYSYLRQIHELEHSLFENSSLSTTQLHARSKTVVEIQQRFGLIHYIFDDYDRCHCYLGKNYNNFSRRILFSIPTSINGLQILQEFVNSLPSCHLRELILIEDLYPDEDQLQFLAKIEMLLMIFFAESTFEELKYFCSKDKKNKQDFKPLWFWIQLSDECHGIYNCLSSQNLLRMLVKPSSSNDLWTKELKDIQALLQGSLSTNAGVSFEQKHKTITRLFRPMDRKLSRLNRRYKTARTQNKVKSVNDDLRRIWNLENNDGDCTLKTQSRQQQGETCRNKINSVFVSGISADPVVSAEISSENTCISSEIDACKNMNSSGDCENKNSNVRCEIVTEIAIGNNTNINSDSPLSTAIESDSLYENHHSGSDRIKDETSMKRFSAEKRNKSTPIESRMENFLKRAKKIRKFYGKDFPGSVAAAQSISTLSDELQLGAYAPIVFCQYFLKFGTRTLDHISEFSQHLKLICNHTSESEKAQRTMLGVIEQTVYAHKTYLLPRTPHILKSLYDHDIVDEKLILAWASKPTKKFVKRSFVRKMIEISKPVLDWLADDSDTEDQTD